MQFLAFEHDVYVAVFGMIAKFQFCEDARCWPLQSPISAVLGFCLQSPKEKICLCTSSLLYLPEAPMPSLQRFSVCWNIAQHSNAARFLVEFFLMYVWLTYSHSFHPVARQE